MVSKYLLLIFLFCSMFSWSQNLRTDGVKIVDQTGNEVILKGMGLGGWMLQEGYMMQSSDVANTQHEFKNKLIDLVGVDKTNEFYNAWLANHVTKKDIDSLAKWGFNSVRLPMHYNLFTLPIEDEPVAGSNTWLTTGFTMVDNLLDWCEANKIYLILDLHAAPGGQGEDAAISDYDATKPSLWESEDNKNKTIALWRKLAERYKDEPYIGGYDLLNEVNWTLSNNTALKSLYVAITNSIREVDSNHIIFIEGNWFANDFTGLTPAWDSNMAYSFHKYWSANDTSSIQWVLDLRNQQNVPLWMGEAGENSNVWFTEAIKLFEDNNIGWSWWPLKRIETIVGPYSIKFTDGYKNILNYWKGETSKPSVETAYAAIMELANNSNSANCSYQKDVLDAMLRQTKTDQTLPYKNHTIPGTVYMSDFDLGKNGFAYYDQDYANYQLSTGSFQAWNDGWVYRNDGVDIVKSTDAVNSNGYYVGYAKKGEWMNYTVNISETAVYKAEVRLAAQSNGGQYHLEIDGEEVTATKTVATTGGWEKFQTIEIPSINLNAGEHVLKFQFDAATEFNISSIKFSKTGETSTSNFTAINGNTNSENTVDVVVNLDLDLTTVANSKSYFTLFVNNVETPITAVETTSEKNRSIQITTSKTLIYTDVIKVSYNGTTLKSETGKLLDVFSNLEIRNTLNTLFVLPTKIEAENYVSMVGLATEDTTDNGGGKNIGYTDANDYADYTIYSENAASYNVNFRLAVQSNTGQIGLYLVDENLNETELLKVTTPVTGGWQTWSTVTSKVIIPAGIHTLRMRVLTGGFNFNWMEFVLIETNGDLDGDGILDENDNCPNTTEGATVDINGCEVFTLPADNFSIVANGETCPDKKNGKIIITPKENYNYQLTINGLVRSFSNTITLASLAPDTYNFCITVDGETFKQCFELVIAAGTTISGKTSVTNNKATVIIEKGTAPFTVYVNDEVMFETTNSIIGVTVKQGDVVQVKTAIDCEGVITKKIDLLESVVAYPNPSKGIFEIAVPVLEEQLKIEIYNTYGQLIMSNQYQSKLGKVQVDLSNKPDGLYLVKVYLNNPITVKLIKE